MSKSRKHTEELSCGGSRLPDRLRRTLPALPSQQTNVLVKHIMRLKAMHPEIHIKFRDVQLTDMDECTLQLLLDDLNEQLGID